MYVEWFYTTNYGIFGQEEKATEISPPDNLTRSIITQSKGFARKGIEKISRSMMAYVYLVLSSQVQTRLTMVGNFALAVNDQQPFKNTFNSLINEDLSIDIKKYQGVLEHALSKVDFSVGRGIYMLPSNLNLVTGKIHCNNKILVRNTDVKIGSNKDINRDHKKFPVAKPNVAPHDPVGGVITSYNLNLRILTEKHNDEKLAITVMIVGTEIIAYHFW